MRSPHRLNYCFERGFGRDIPCLLTHLYRAKTLSLIRSEPFFLNGLIDITGGDVALASGFASVFALLDMTYTKRSIQ